MRKKPSARREALRCYKRRLYGGRTAFARVVDFVMLRLVALAVLLLWFYTRIDNAVLIWLLSIVALMMLSVAIELIGSIRLERFIRKERDRMRTQAFAEKLLMLPAGGFHALMCEYIRTHAGDFDADASVFPVRRREKLDEDMLVLLCRRAAAYGSGSAVVVSVSEADKAALSAINRYSGVKLKILDANALQEVAPELIPDDDAIDELVIEQDGAVARARKEAVSEPFKSSRVRRYALVALGLFILSFFTEYSLYYRLLAGACVSFGALAWWVGAPAAHTAK